MFNPLQNEALDEWFQRFNAPLKRLPTEERAELYAEVRQHLDALVAANEELGSPPEEAWELALVQFGDPGAIGRRLAWEWRRGRGWISPDMTAVLYGLGITAATFFGVTLVLNSSWLWSGWWAFLSVHSEAVFGTAYMATVPVLTGAAVGKKFPKQALTGAFYSAALLPILPVTVFMEVACLFGHERVGVTLGVNLILFVLAGAWLLLSGAAAYVASARKRRQWYCPRRADFTLTLPRRRPRLSRRQSGTPSRRGSSW